ncbi:MAG: HAD family hydrolase [Candidatus Eisenbacteria bacterium]|nr:HAD family hydrolase [Candidatus Eisenbacteria bacterium]
MALPAGFLLALEGVLVSEGAPIDGSIEAIVRLRAMGCPFRVLADATPASREVLAGELGGFGFSIDPDEIRVSASIAPDPRAEARPDSAPPSREALLRTAAADLGLATGAAILVVGDDYDSEIRPALDLGFSGLLVLSGDAVDESRIGTDIPAALVAVNFGAWLYRTLRLR